MRGLELSSSMNLVVVNCGDAAIGEGCWWGRWVGIDIYAGKDWIVIGCHNVRRGYDRVEGSIGSSYD